MGEQFFNWVWNTANIPFARWGILAVITGLRALCRGILSKYYGINIMPGLTIYPERRLLDKYTDLEETLKMAEIIEAYSIIGFNLMNKVTRPERYVKKLLLPRPDCNSLKNLEDTTSREGNFTPTIKTSTQIAIKNKIPVRWYPEFIGYSYYIANRNKDNGWVHVEYVLPHTSDHLKRPSMRINKKEYPKIFNYYVEAFDEMWSNAYTPTDEDLN